MTAAATHFDAGDHRFMSRALALAARGLNACEPNPRVGCVLVRDGQIVGEGWHQRAGQAHAEVHALRAAGERARGATVYVTLEPCCHHGQTPPCTRALHDAGVARVVAAVSDPDPRVAMHGFAALASSGIPSTVGCLEAQARALNAGFFMRHGRGRPRVRTKLASSLDGATAMANGESRWITGEAARRDVQRLRARAGAILTGVQTVLADDPALTVRDTPQAPWRQPLRVVLDSTLRTPATARLLAEPGETLICHAASGGAAALEGCAALLAVPRAGRGLDLSAVLAALAARGVNEVLVEAGATLNGALLEQGLIDELVLYLAPHLMGRATRGLFELPGLDAIADRYALELRELRRVGADLRITAVPAPRTGAR